MNIVTLLQPPRVVIGDGCAPQCVDLLVQCGARRVLFVTTKSVRPQVSFLTDSFQRAGCEVIFSRYVPPEPTVAFFNATLAEVKAAQIDSVLGVGGGSALDIAKLLAALAQGDQTIAEALGVNRLHGRKVPLVCLPTTAGTGSEVSPNAVLLDEAAQSKAAAISPHLVPDAAFIDPLLTHSVPPAITAATGLDALTHCIEAFANKVSHPAVDVYALEGIRLIAANLERAVRDGRDAEARANLALGSFYGGLCLGPVNTAAVHALSYPLGGRFNIAHGVSNAVLLPHVLRFNLPAAPDRYAEVATALGVARNGSPHTTAEYGLGVLAQLSKACGVPQTLAELNVPRTAIPEMARIAMQVQRLLKNNPRVVTEADAVQIYEATY